MLQYFGQSLFFAPMKSCRIFIFLFGQAILVFSGVLFKRVRAKKKSWHIENALSYDPGQKFCSGCAAEVFASREIHARDPSVAIMSWSSSSSPLEFQSEEPAFNKSWNSKWYLLLPARMLRLISQNCVVGNAFSQQQKEKRRVDFCTMLVDRDRGQDNDDARFED